jgi:hypothetical protein
MEAISGLSYDADKNLSKIKKLYSKMGLYKKVFDFKQFHFLKLASQDFPILPQTKIII